MNDFIDNLIDSNRDSNISADELFRARAALCIALLAAILAIAGLMGDNADQDQLASNVQAANMYAFYQAKAIRQTDYKLALDGLNWELDNNAALSAAQRAALQERRDKYQGTVDRYESEPDASDPNNPLKGEGKKELLLRARHYESARDEAATRGANFDYAAGLLQIAIVIASVAIITLLRPLLYVALALGGVGLLLVLNGAFSIVTLPF
ncbi:MAG: hypothetical protein B6D41_17280 [Chloroflexi bacterium UTCFX4]|jgi:hypothetical protein|nr:MAG: hypothetical protein B6D41_17280 [Chloroflexi bacterium UTCFX4]